MRLSVFFVFFSVGIYLQAGLVQSAGPVSKYAPSDKKITDGRLVRVYVINDYQRWKLFDKAGKSLEDLERHTAKVIEDVEKIYQNAGFAEEIHFVLAGQRTFTNDVPTLETDKEFRDVTAMR
eukprot:249875_1